MIVIAIIAIIAAIAIPNLIESRVTAAESSAASSLRSGVYTGQETFRGSAYNDLDQDNQGEFGHLGHLAGARQTWGSPVVGIAGIQPGSLEMLGDDWSGVDAPRLSAGSTDDSINGYFYASYLDADSTVDPFNSAAEELQVNNAEIYFAAVAVPQSFNNSGRRSFVITNGGLVMTTVGTDLFEGDPDAVLDSTTTTISCYDTVGSAVTRDNRVPWWSGL